MPLLPCAAIIFVFALQHGLLSKLLRTPLFVVLGEISFSMYLLHCVFLAYLGVGLPFRDTLQDALLYMIVLFVSAYLMTVAFEKPVRKALMRLADRFLFPKSERATMSVATRSP